MNKLTTSETFAAYAKFKPDVVKMLNPAMISKYEIPSTFYDNWYKPLTAKKYPLVHATLEAAKAGLIHLFNFTDPYDISEKKTMLHPGISAILGLDNKKRLVSFVNAQAKAGFTRNIDKEPVGLKLDENSLYSYLQTGYTAVLINKKDREVTDNVKLQQTLAELYALVLAKTVDNIYPVTGELDAAPRLNFLCALFYLQYHAGYDLEKAIKLALKIRIVDPVIVATKSRAMQQNILTMHKYDDFVQSLRTEFPFINMKDFELRATVSAYTRLCGPASFFAIEHFQSFLNMVQNVALKTGIFFDWNLSKMLTPNMTGEVNKILQLIGGD